MRRRGIRQTDREHAWNFRDKRDPSRLGNNVVFRDTYVLPGTKYRGTCHWLSWNLLIPGTNAMKGLIKTRALFAVRLYVRLCDDYSLFFCFASEMSIIYCSAEEIGSSSFSEKTCCLGGGVRDTS